MKCPHCNQNIVLFADAGRIGGSAKSEAKAKASRLNGKPGGRPKAVKDEPVKESEGYNES